MFNGLLGMGGAFALVAMSAGIKLALDGEVLAVLVGCAASALVAAPIHHLNRGWVREHARAPSADRPVRAAVLAVLALTPGIALTLWIALSSFFVGLRVAILALMLGLAIGLLLDARAVRRIAGGAT